jgi:hypothetical protein
VRHSLRRKGQPILDNNYPYYFFFQSATYLLSIKHELRHHHLKMEQNISVLSSIATKVSTNTNTLETYFRSKNLPELGFGTEALIAYDTVISDPEIARARKELANDAKKLLLLALGPVESFHLGIMSVRCDFMFLRHRVNVSTANSTAWRATRALSFQNSSNSAS